MINEMFKICFEFSKGYMFVWSVIGMLIGLGVFAFAVIQFIRILKV